MNKIEIKSDDNILIVAPHPDDECIGVGGILHSFSNQCTVVVLTDGSLGQNNNCIKECAEKRKSEFVEEMNYLGLGTYYMLDLPDGQLMSYQTCLNEFDLSAYSIIFVTGLEDNHPDHSAAYICVQNAVRFQHIANTLVYLYEVHNTLIAPTHYLDISDCYEVKNHLIHFHQSQIQLFPYDEMARSLAVYRGLQNRMVGKKLEVFALADMSAEIDGGIIKLAEQCQKYKMFYNFLLCWIKEKDGKAFANFFEERNIKECVIYGYSDLGKLLMRECESNNIKVKYVIDQKIKSYDEGVRIDSLKQCMNHSETVIVTAIYEYESIRKNLHYYGYENIISLRDIMSGGR